MGLSGALKNPAQRAYLFVAIVFTFISILAIILRFVATRRAGRTPRIEGWLALLSLLLYLGFGVVNLFVAEIANGRNAVELLASPEDFSNEHKLIYAALWLYFYQQLFAKASVMALYYRLFWVNSKFKLSIDGLVCYHLAWITVTSECESTGTLLAVTETINSLGDFLLVALAVFVIPALQTPRATKQKLIVFFGLGILAGAVGFIKIGISFNNDAVYVFTAVALWSNIQAGIGIVCCCAPAYQPILPGPNFWARMASKFSISSLLHLSSPGNSAEVSSSRGDRHSGRRYWLQEEDERSTGLVWLEPPTIDSGYMSADNEGNTHPGKIDMP
ncbi:hypothetical protein F5Y16DRAFT_406712 [Xylariaceae sp. FL0255]|nr:hypothetical protein F5Y16DRAFT_406712 [Xylariaceae sp. FL0255]